MEHRHDTFLGYRLYRTQRAVHRDLEEALAPFGISPAQWNALNQLERRGPLSQRQLAAAIQREPATITRSIDKLEKAGLVERHPDPNDRRANVISLTPAGTDLLSDVQQPVIESNERLLDGLNDEEIRMAIDLLDRVYANCADEEGVQEE